MQRIRMRKKKEKSLIICTRLYGYKGNLLSVWERNDFACKESLDVDD